MNDHSAPYLVGWLDFHTVSSLSRKVPISYTSTAFYCRGCMRQYLQTEEYVSLHVVKSRREANLVRQKLSLVQHMSMLKFSDVNHVGWIEFSSKDIAWLVLRYIKGSTATILMSHCSAHSGLLPFTRPHASTAYFGARAKAYLHISCSCR